MVWRLPLRVQGHIGRMRDGREKASDVAEGLTFGLTCGLLSISHHLDVHMTRNKMDKHTATHEGIVEILACATATCPEYESRGVRCRTTLVSDYLNTLPVSLLLPLCRTH